MTVAEILGCASATNKRLKCDADRVIEQLCGVERLPSQIREPCAGDGQRRAWRIRWFATAAWAAMPLADMVSRNRESEVLDQTGGGRGLRIGNKEQKICRSRRVTTDLFSNAVDAVRN